MSSGSLLYREEAVYGQYKKMHNNAIKFKDDFLMGYTV